MTAKNKDKSTNLLGEWKSLAKELCKVWKSKDIGGKILDNIANVLSKKPDQYFNIDDMGMDPHLVENLRPFFQFLYYQYWRVDVDGIKNIPDKGPALIVANHSGGLPADGIMINMAVYNEHHLSRNVRFLVEDFIYHFPFLGTFFQRAGGVRACPENATHLLKTGNLTTVFPEGIKGPGKLYRNKYKIARFGRGGFVKIAIKTKTKIIPTAVIGAEETYPILWKSSLLAKPFGIPYLPITPIFPILGPLGLMPLPSKWIIKFGKPIDCSVYKKSDSKNELLVYEITERARDEVKRLIKKGLEERSSIWE